MPGRSPGNEDGHANTRGGSPVKIASVRTILTAPAGIPLVVVKVETSEPGLYGLGCGTFTQRATAVRTAVDDYLAPLLAGRDPGRIEDTWHTCMHNAYWRNGPVLNNALSGVDMALWDIKGKRAGMPVYELLGGKCREAAAVYRHADGRDPEEVTDRARAFQEEGYTHIRCQLGGYGGIGRSPRRPDNALPGAYFDPDVYAQTVPAMFEHVRNALGFDVHLLHDVHERLQPIEAVRFAKALEPYRLFFLEDLLAPEDIEWFRHIRAHAAVPIAMGELFNNPVEWKPLIANQLIDFIRVHISQIGGISPARKLAALCEAFGVRTAWHGPGDVAPVGHAANLHLDLACQNFGIQEFAGFNDALREVFPGCPEVRNGYLYPNANPGLGIDIDEALAARYPVEPKAIEWTQTRLPDGTPVRP
ncbi:MAG: starvation-sensing protein RspA [Candidatus Hydrogenedentes bacterium]|nr:starvation-sensing protein RspA [Candidatus Hydrogenedentota bacterium]